MKHPRPSPHPSPLHRTITRSFTITEMKGRIRKAQVDFVLKVGGILFAVLPFVGFLVVYFFFASGSDKKTLRHGILVLPVGILGVAVALLVVRAVLSPDSRVWKSSAIRAVTSAYTRGHKEGISCVCVVRATAETYHDEDHIYTCGKEDGKVKVWSSTTGQLLRGYQAHTKGVIFMGTNMEQTKMFTSGISSSDGGEL